MPDHIFDGRSYYPHMHIVPWHPHLCVSVDVTNSVVLDILEIFYSRIWVFNSLFNKKNHIIDLVILMELEFTEKFKLTWEIG